MDEDKVAFLETQCTTTLQYYFYVWVDGSYIYFVARDFNECRMKQHGSATSVSHRLHSALADWRGL